LLTAATAVVSLLFVAVLVGDLLLVSRVSNLSTAPVPQAMMEAPPMIEPVELEAEAERADEMPAPAPLPAEALPEAPVEAPVVTMESSPIIEESEAGVERADEMPIAAPLPPPPGASPVATAEEELYVADVPGDADATVAAAGGGPADEATGLTLTPASTTVVEEAPVAFTSPAEATPEPKAPRSAEPRPSVADEEKFEMVEEGEWKTQEYGLVAPSPTLPWRALEIALGLAALALVFFTIRAWRARRQ
jgi:hypothetical protein